MRAFLAFLRIVALATLLVVIHDPEWVSTNTPWNVSVMPDTDVHYMLLAFVGGLLALELLSAFIAIIFVGTGKSAQEAREKVANRYVPMSQWGAEIDALNLRDAAIAGDRGQHNPCFAISRSSRLKRVTVHLKDDKWDYYAKESFMTLTMRSYERFEQKVKEMKLKLMHEYIIAMKASAPAQEDSREAVKAEEQAAFEAATLSSAASNGTTATPTSAASA